jgi:hypothetical protein
LRLLLKLDKACYCNSKAFEVELMIVIYNPSFGWLRLALPVIIAIIVLATVTMVVNYDCTVIRIVNDNCETFVIKATG